jgi:hypothetical protein
MRRKTAWFLVLCLAMVLLLGASVIASEQNDAGSGQDASNEREGAWSLRPGTFTGFLEYDDDCDWYKIDLEQEQIFSIGFTVPEAAEFSLHLYRGTRFVASLRHVVGQANTIQYATGGEIWYIKVVRHSASEGEYELNIKVKNQNDAGSGRDVGGEEHGALLLTPGTFTGFLEVGDRSDCYRIEHLRGAIITINLTVPETANFDFMRTPRPLGNKGYVLGEDKTIHFVPPRGTYYFKVIRNSGEGEYQLTIEIQDQNDAGSGQDASDEREGAYPLTPGTFTGFLMSRDKVDWYKVTGLAWRQLLEVDLTVPETATLKLTYHKGLMGQQRAGGLLFGPGTHDNAIHHIGSGDYYIRVELLDGYGEYTLTVRSQAYEGDPMSPQLPTPDGVSIPFLKKDPSVASGSSCRGACGSGCPDTRQERPDIVRCFPDPNDANAHLFLTYSSVIECGTHAGCREHDACFDRCAEDGEESVVGPCHDVCSAAIVAQYNTAFATSWYWGGGPYDGYLLFSDPPAWSESNPGRVEYTEYRVRVATGDLGLLPRGEGTNAGVYLTLLGTLFGTPRCSSAKIQLDTPNYNDFEAGNHEYFVVTAERFDSVDGIVLRHDNTGSCPGWYVDDLVITALSTGTTWRVDVDRWLALDEEDGRLRVEFFTTLAE